MGHGASPAESSGSPEQIRLAGVDAVIPLDAQGKLSPARPGPGPPHSLCWLGSAAKSFEAPGVRVPAPPAAALRSGEVTGLPGHTSVPKRCGCGTPLPGARVGASRSRVRGAAGSEAALLLRHRGLILPRAPLRASRHHCQFKPRGQTVP